MICKSAKLHMLNSSLNSDHTWGGILLYEWQQIAMPQSANYNVIQWYFPYGIPMSPYRIMQGMINVHPFVGWLNVCAVILWNRTNYDWNFHLKKGVPSDQNLTSLSIMNFNKQGVFDYKRLNSEYDCSYKIKMGLFYEEFSHPPSGMLSTSRYGDWNWYFIIVMKFQ